MSKIAASVLAKTLAASVRSNWTARCVVRRKLHYDSARAHRRISLHQGRRRELVCLNSVLNSVLDGSREGDLAEQGRQTVSGYVAHGVVPHAAETRQSTHYSPRKSYLELILSLPGFSRRANKNTAGLNRATGATHRNLCSADVKVGLRFPIHSLLLDDFFHLPTALRMSPRLETQRETG